MSEVELDRSRDLHPNITDTPHPEERDHVNLKFNRGARTRSGKARSTSAARYLSP